MRLSPIPSAFAALLLSVSAALAQAPSTPAAAAAAAATPAAAAAAAATPAAATPADIAVQTALFDRIRAAYYHPGKVALSCDATLDFTAALAKLGDTESAKSLNGLKVHVNASDSKYAELTFTWPSSVPADSRAQVETGAKQVIGGFFQAYWPIANAEMVPPLNDHPTVTDAPGGGYLITTAVGKGSSRLTVSSDGLIQRVDTRLPTGQTSSLALSYTASPKPQPGDLMRFSGLAVDRPTASMRIQATMKWDDQEVSGIFLPHRIAVAVPGAFEVPVVLSGCTVGPDPAAKQ